VSSLPENQSIKMAKGHSSTNKTEKKNNNNNLQSAQQKNLQNERQINRGKTLSTRSTQGEMEIRKG